MIRGGILASHGCSSTQWIARYKWGDIRANANGSGISGGSRETSRCGSSRGRLSGGGYSLTF